MLIEATSCKWRRHLGKVVANSFCQSPLWLSRKLPHKLYLFYLIILSSLLCQSPFWKFVVYRKSFCDHEIVGFKNWGANWHFGNFHPSPITWIFWLLKIPSACVFVGQVDLQEKLVGGTFLKQQMHNFKSSYAESRPFPAATAIKKKKN